MSRLSLAALDQMAAMRKEWEDLGTRTADTMYNQEWIECIQIENMLQCLELVLGAGPHPHGESGGRVSPGLP